MPFSGRKLRQLRKEAGLTHQALADKAGVSVYSLRCWEYAQRKPKLDALLALAKALGVPLEALLEAKPRKKRK